MKRSLRGATPRDAEAYQLYLKGRYFWNKRNEEGFRNGIEYFNARKRRSDVRARVFRTGGFIRAALRHRRGAPADEMPKAKAAAQRQSTRIPTLAEAYTSRAFVRLLTTGTGWARNAISGRR